MPANEDFSQLSEHIRQKLIDLALRWEDAQTSGNPASAESFFAADPLVRDDPRLLPILMSWYAATDRFDRLAAPP